MRKYFILILQLGKGTQKNLVSSLQSAETRLCHHQNLSKWQHAALVVLIMCHLIWQCPYLISKLSPTFESLWQSRRPVPFQPGQFCSFLFTQSNPQYCAYLRISMSPENCFFQVNPCFFTTLDAMMCISFIWINRVCLNLKCSNSPCKLSWFMCLCVKMSNFFILTI